MRRRPCEPPCAPVFFVYNGARGDAVLLTLTSGSGVTFKVINPIYYLLGGGGGGGVGGDVLVFAVFGCKSFIFSVMECAVKLRVSGILFYCCDPDS
jgi:hypothetical protein